MSSAPALSTMWLQTRFERVAPFARAAAAMGFEQIELSHILPEAALADFAPQPVRVAAVHHPCPLPDRRVPRLSDLDGAARREAVAAARTSVDTAVRFGAPVVVVHVGEIPELEYWEDELRSRTLAGQQGTVEYGAAMERFRRDRAVKRGRYVAASLASLREVAAYARERGIQIGLESREFAREIPDSDDMAELLGALPDYVGFWLDTGHTAITARLGFAGQDEWLRRHGERLVGLHLHDAIGLRDHLTPGLGDVDFAAIAPYLREATVRTCELDWFYTPREIRAGVECLVAAGCCAPLRPMAGDGSRS